MDVKLAATFIRVAELGNITRAAEQLGYSQASVSAHIQQLEEQLGVPLFDRIGRGIQLTDAGMRFRRYAVDLLKASEDADAFTLDRQNPSGMLYIGAGSSVSIGLLPRILPGFHDRYPDVRVSVNVTEDTDVLMDHLRQNRIDIAIPTDILSDYPGCVRAAERYEQFVFTAPAGDPIAKKKNVPLEEVFDRSYISVFISENKDNHYRYVLEPHLAARGIELQPAMEFGNNASIVRLLLQGTGRAFLPKFMIEDEVSTDRLAIIDTEHIDVQLYSQVFYSQNRWINPQIQAFLGYIRENL